jgi:hypothetical protein
LRLDLSHRRAGLGAVITVVAVMVSGGAAAADDVTPAARAVAAGPLLTAPGVVWAEYDRTVVSPPRPSGFSVRASDGGQPRTLGVEAPGQSMRTPVLATAPGLVAASAFVRRFSGPGAGSAEVSSVRGWSADGVVSPMFGACDPTVVTLGLIDAAGGEVATCGRGAAAVEVFDGRSGTLTDRFSAARSVAGVRLAGRLVAWLEQTGAGVYDIVVYDRDARTELLRWNTAPVGSGLGDWDLQADGTVAYAVDGRLGWTSPSAPVGHRIGLERDLTSRLLLVDGSIVVRRGSVRDGTLVAVTMSGAVTTLARGVGAGFDVDATRIAFVRPGCERDTVVIRRRGDGAVSLPAPRCALKLVRGPRIAADGRHVTVTVSCAAFPLRCYGDSMLSLRRDGRPVVLARGSIDGDGTTRMVLRATARRLLRGGHVLDARLTARLGLAGDTVRRERAVRLRRPS